MKKLLITLLALSAFSTFATTDVTISNSEDPAIGAVVKVEGDAALKLFRKLESKKYPLSGALGYANGAALVLNKIEFSQGSCVIESEAKLVNSKMIENIVIKYCLINIQQ